MTNHPSVLSNTWRSIRKQWGAVLIIILAVTCIIVIAPDVSRAWNHPYQGSVSPVSPGENAQALDAAASDFVASMLNVGFSDIKLTPVDDPDFCDTKNAYIAQFTALSPSHEAVHGTVCYSVSPTENRNIRMVITSAPGASL